MASLTIKQIAEVRDSLVATAGTCAVMGTASTMACLTEALGMTLPGGASAPAVSAARLSHAARTGRRAVELARAGGPTPREVMTPAAFRNAIRVLAALGGSTNAIIHLTAVARRAGVPLDLDDFERVAETIPLLVDLKPSGRGYMQDFDRSGGMPALLKALEPMLETETVGVVGQALGELLAATEERADWQDHVRGLDDPLGPPGSLAVLRGSLAPDGAVIKVSAASPELLTHTGPAIVINSPDEAEQILDDPGLNVTADHVLVLRNAGPVAAGMPEAGALPIPAALARAGVRDMVRISDARMSGTSYGTVVLHCAPEAAVGGPLALVRTGDLISLDVPARRIDLLVDEAELDRRRGEFMPPPVAERGWLRLYQRTVLQANEGADLSFLAPPGGRS